MKTYILTDCQLAEPLRIEADSIEEATNKARAYYYKVLDVWTAASDLYDATIYEVKKLTPIEEL